MSSNSGRARNAGFTMVELLIAAVLAGIFATVLFQLLMGQSQFAGVQSAREEVGQNARGAMELLSSELRAVPGGAITAATATSVRFQLPRVWGITCAATGSATVTAVFPGLHLPRDLPANFATTTSTTWGVAVEVNPTADPGEFQGQRINGTHTSFTACQDLGQVVASTERADSAVARGFTLSGNLPTTPMASRVFIYQDVEYDVGTSSTVPGRWLRRTTGDGTKEPLAGPLLERTDFNPVEFVYLCDGAPLDASLLATAEGRAKVDAVQIRLAMQSRRTHGPSGSKVPEIEADTLTVHLRNTGNVPCL